MLPQMFPKVLFSPVGPLLFSTYTPLLLLLLPLSLSLSSNSLKTHNFKFLFLHSTFPVKSIALRNVSLPCTPGAVFNSPSPYPLILKSLILFSLELGNVLTLSRMSPRSTSRLFHMADHVKLLGVTLNNHLLMDKHVNEVSRTRFHHLLALRHIRPAVTAINANMIACFVVGSRLDYANVVFYGVSS